MADLDEEELAYYQELCERLQACRRTHPERQPSPIQLLPKRSYAQWKQSSASRCPLCCG